MFKCVLCECANSNKYNPSSRLYISSKISTISTFEMNSNFSSLYVRHELLRHNCVRKSTFKNWPNKNKSNYNELVAAGFYYSQHGDEVICFSCNIRISGWEAYSQPYFLHRALSPYCNFLKGYDLSINQLPLNGKLCAVSLPTLVPSSEFQEYDATVSQASISLSSSGGEITWGGQVRGNPLHLTPYD